MDVSFATQLACTSSAKANCVSPGSKALLKPLAFPPLAVWSLALQVYRVLKPGGTLVYVQRVRGGPLQPLVGGTDGAVGALVGVVGGGDG